MNNNKTSANLNPKKPEINYKDISKPGQCKQQPVTLEKVQIYLAW
jgi:hypothetical protein